MIKNLKELQRRKSSFLASSYHLNFVKASLKSFIKSIEDKNIIVSQKLYKWIEPMKYSFYHLSNKNH